MRSHWQQASGGDRCGKSPDHEAIAGSKDNAEIMKNDWTRFQKNLAKLSNSTYRVAEQSAHNIPLEQPQIIVEAIEGIVGRMQARP